MILSECCDAIPDDRFINSPDICSWCGEYTEFYTSSEEENE